jgi:ubiquinol-cytochrome c reductase cytochrome c subunit
VTGHSVQSNQSDSSPQPGVPSAAAKLSARRRHPLASFVVLGFGLLLMGGLYGALTGGGTASAASTDGSPQAIAKGRAIFLEGCSSCHGLNAQGGSTAPTLIGVGAAAVDFQVGTGRMPLAGPSQQAKRGRVQYSQQEISELAAYVASLAPGPAIPSAEELDYLNANLQEGGELFRTNCAQCHNFNGAGGALTEGQYAPSLKYATPQQMFEVMLTGPQSMPVFANSTMTVEEKQAIIKYVTAIRDSPNPGGMSLGRLGPVSEGLLLWIIGLGAVTGIAVWIGAKSS